MAASLRMAPVLVLILLSVGEAGAEVPWHVLPPGTEYKSLSVPREPAAFVALSYRRGKRGVAGGPRLGKGKT